MECHFPHGINQFIIIRVLHVEKWRPLHFSPTDTIREEQLFKPTLGPFASDMVLVNITFSSVVLSVAACNARGFNVQELSSQNGSKTFTLQVPFMDPLVTKTVSIVPQLGTFAYSKLGLKLFLSGATTSILCFSFLQNRKKQGRPSIPFTCSSACGPCQSCHRLLTLRIWMLL